MKWLLVVAAVIGLTAPSYGAAAPPEGAMGSALPAKGSGAAPSARPRALMRTPDAPGWAARRLADAVADLKPDGRAAVRGSKEMELYQMAAPAVVLVVADEVYGSGVLVTADGKIVTNLHVVGDLESVGVVFKPKVEGAKIEDMDIRLARVIRRDAVADLALLQIANPPPGVTPLPLAPPEAAQVGADVHAIGHPTGETWTYTRGIISQVRRDYEWSGDRRASHKATVIQTQTPVNPGNSGGPLLNDAMQIVGINSFKGEGEGMNYAVSAEDLRAFLARADDRAAPKKAIDPSCKGEVLEEFKWKEPKGTAFRIDEDCDGSEDYIYIEPAKSKLPAMSYIDDNGDGKTDTILYDDGRDGHVDSMVMDTDYDGDPDVRADFRPGEDEPYRYERLTD